MDWFSCPLQEVLGISTFWINRIAKLIQLLAGSVILIEIIGKDRVEELASMVRLRLIKIIAAEPLRELLTRVRIASKDLAMFAFHFFMSVFYSDNRKKDEKYKYHHQRQDYYAERIIKVRYWRYSMILMLLLPVVVAIIGTIIYIDTQNVSSYPSLYRWHWTIILKALGTFGIMLFVGFYGCFIVFFVLIPYIALFFILIIVYPIKWMLDQAASVSIRLLQNKEASQLALIISFTLFVVGVILELIAS